MEFQGIDIKYEIGVCIERQLLLRAFILLSFLFDILTSCQTQTMI